MTTRSRLEAELATRRYTRRHAREIVTAILGNNAGTVVATTDTRWYWVRLHGDPNQVVRAWNAGFVPPVNNLPVDVEIIKANGITDYQIIGVSINKSVAADVYAGATGMHALQHQRRDFNTGGFDPLDVYARAIVQLRARAQATPDMTLYVEPGFYPVAGIATYFAGGNSAAFVAPGGGSRCDLLYLDNAGALQIVTGSVVPLGTPPRPAQPAATDLPLAYVYLTAATTSITEYIIEDARLIFGGGGGGGGHTIQEEGTPLTQRSNLNFVGGDVTATDDAGNDATIITIEDVPIVQTSAPGSPHAGELWYDTDDTGGFGVSSNVGVSLVVSEGGAAITDGTKFFFAWPWTGTLTQWDLISDLSGNITFDVQDADYASFPGSAASIWGGSIPALAGASKAQATGLSISITKGHWAQVVISGAATMKNTTLALYLTRT